MYVASTAIAISFKQSYSHILQIGSCNNCNVIIHNVIIQLQL